jgi:capsular polysaccharide biosynthesis protein
MDMSPREYLHIIAKRWWLIAATTAIGLIAGIVLTLMTTPIYRSAIKISVNPARPDYGTALTVNNLLTNYSIRLQTVTLAQSVVDQLRLDIAPETLLGKIKVTPEQDNFMLLIEADDPNPQTAEQIALTLATTFVNQYTAENAEAPRQDRIDLSLLDTPDPARLNKPKLEINLPAGLLAGMIIGVVLAFVLEYIDDTIKTTEDIDRVMAMPTLGSIPAS